MASQVGPPQYEIDCNRDDLVRATPKCELTRVAESLQLALVDLPPGIVRIAVSIAWLETGSTSTWAARVIRYGNVVVQSQDALASSAAAPPSPHKTTG